MCECVSVCVCGVCGVCVYMQVVCVVCVLLCINVVKHAHPSGRL